MFRSKYVVPFAAAALLTAGCSLVPVSLYAAPLHSNPDVHAPKTSKPVKLSVANSSSETLQLRVGEQAVSVAPGATVAISAEVGAKIVNVDANKSHAAGEVIAEVSKALSGATLRIS